MPHSMHTCVQRLCREDVQRALRPCSRGGPDLREPVVHPLPGRLQELVRAPPGSDSLTRLLTAALAALGYDIAGHACYSYFRAYLPLCNERDVPMFACSSLMFSFLARQFLSSITGRLSMHGSMMMAHLLSCYNMFYYCSQ
ncbi:hypothetical protein VPH35_087356 [Triticum aestivum]